MTTIAQAKLLEILARLKASAVSSQKPPDISEISDNLAPQELYTLPESEPPQDLSHIYDKYGKPITLNHKQNEFVSIAASGASAVLVGAAGTGKTTCQKAVCQALITSGRAGILAPGGHKHLREGTPGILIVAYTRIAVNNIRRNLPEDLQSNAITVHKALEFQPVYNSTIDETSGKEVTKMSFEPARGGFNPLSPTIHTVIIEEGSMLSVELHSLLLEALPHCPQFIYLGDIQQLPPVFGLAILGFKMLELPVVELTEVYRQALESPIISLAHRILSGAPLPSTEFKALNVPGQLTLVPWKKKISSEDAMDVIGKFFISPTSPKLPTGGLLQSGKYDPTEDMILIPFNKGFGTLEMNRIIGTALAKLKGSKVFEIIAGFDKCYYCIGDRVLYDREDAVITKIEHNFAYSGQVPSKESETLDYWGVEHSAKASLESSYDDMDFVLSQIAAQTGASEERVRQASHVITLKLTDSEQEIRISKAAEFNSMLLGYALTVHKAQGSEWRRVFFLTHHTHATMMSRELLYTAVTRAREELYVICEPEGLTKGIASQRIKGNTLEEKAEFFKGKASSSSSYSQGI